MHGLKKIILLLPFLAGCAAPSLGAGELRIITPTQGGTGIGSATTTDVGKVLSVSSSSPFAYQFTTVTSVSTSTTNTWTAQQNFNGGITYSTASSTATTTLGTTILTGFPNGSVLFTTSTGKITSDTRFTYNNSSNQATIGTSTAVAGAALTVAGGDIYWTSVNGSRVQFFNTPNSPGGNNPQLSLVSPLGKSASIYLSESELGLGSFSSNQATILYASGNSAQNISLNRNFTFSQGAQSSGIPTFMTYSPANHTGVTANTAAPLYSFSGNSMTWAASTNISNQGFTTFATSTIAGASASTSTNPATVKINGAPSCGTNMSCVNPLAFHVVTGTSEFGGVIAVGGGSGGKVTCFKSDGKTLGYCSTAVDASGNCTCN